MLGQDLFAVLSRQRGQRPGRSRKEDFAAIERIHQENLSRRVAQEKMRKRDARRNASLRATPIAMHSVMGISFRSITSFRKEFRGS